MSIDHSKQRIFKRFRHRSYVERTVPDHKEHASQATTSMQMMAISQTEVIEKTLDDITELTSYLSTYPVVWLQVSGLGDVVKLEAIAHLFNLHKLAMEDVINVFQRPKIEEYDDIMFAVTRMPNVINGELDLEQISLFWGKNFIISFKELEHGEYLVPLRTRLQNESKRAHMLKPEYISYAIMDIIIDSFFPLLENYGLKLDDIEEDAVANPSSQIIVNIHAYKHDLLVVRRAMWSQREAIRKLVEVTKFDDKDLRFFIRDCEDHTIQIIDILESYRERTSGLMDIYLSAVNNKMNEIMKVLTMISTIFMPTGVIASIYGMNFDRSSPWNLPELGWRYGYEFALGLMLTMAITFLFFFKRKGWIFKKKLPKL